MYDLSGKAACTRWRRSVHGRTARMELASSWGYEPGLSRATAAPWSRAPANLPSEKKCGCGGRAELRGAKNEARGGKQTAKKFPGIFGLF